jgi:hypothetical protein
MNRIINTPMRPKLALDVFIPQQPHLGRQMLAVSTQKTAVEWNRRQKGVRDDAETSRRRAHRAGFGEQT